MRFDQVTKEKQGRERNSTQGGSSCTGYVRPGASKDKRRREARSMRKSTLSIGRKRVYLGRDTKNLRFDCHRRRFPRDVYREGMKQDQAREHKKREGVRKHEKEEKSQPKQAQGWRHSSMVNTMMTRAEQS